MQKPDPLSTLVNIVDEVRARQELDGSIKAPNVADHALINRLITELDRHAAMIDGLSAPLLTATLEDLGNWLKNGLDQRPLFDKTLASFNTPAPGDALFLLAPMRATNGPDPEGFRLELVTGYRSETLTWQRPRSTPSSTWHRFNASSLERPRRGSCKAIA